MPWMTRGQVCLAFLYCLTPFSLKATSVSIATDQARSSSAAKIHSDLRRGPTVCTPPKPADIPRAHADGLAFRRSLPCACQELALRQAPCYQHPSFSCPSHPVLLFCSLLFASSAPRSDPGARSQQVKPASSSTTFGFGIAMLLLPMRRSVPGLSLRAAFVPGTIDPDLFVVFTQTVPPPSAQIPTRLGQGRCRCYRGRCSRGNSGG